MKKAWYRIAVVIAALLLSAGLPLRSKASEAVQKLSPGSEPAVMEVSEHTFVAIGSDLTEDQLDGVLNTLQMTREDLSVAKVIYITNAEEHAALDSYMDAALVGSKSISCVRIDRGEPGSGIQVFTENITYCTAKMYQNALITAGIGDAVMIATAPVSSSGTAALLGAMKAYETENGEAVEQNAIETAMEELVVTGEIAKTTNDADLASEVISYIKTCFLLEEDSQIGKDDEGQSEKVNESLSEKVDTIIEDAEDKFQISFTQEQKDRISDIMMKTDNLNIDTSGLLDQAEALYQKYGADLIDEQMQSVIDSKKLELEELMKEKGEELKEATKEKVEELKDSAVKEAEEKVSGFWSELIASIKNFFTSMFSKEESTEETSNE